jgi:hypothetical protein
METKFYAPQQGLHCLTLATHPGTLTEQDVVNNLVRMSLMDDELSAEEAMEEARQLPTDKRKALVDDMWWEYNSPEFQDYLTVKKLHPRLNLKLKPVEREEALAIMDGMDLQTFKEAELPTVEWD